MIDGLAVVADDLTGACDLAGNVREQGWSAVVRLGVPGGETPLADADCRVVALKSRTAEPRLAASESARAAIRLLAERDGLLYQKYCSTFDSTERGNIGPVGDALAAVRGGAPALTVGTPATPAVGRTQYLGHLFVGGALLAESPMRTHPLTPMRDSLLPRLLQAQTRAGVALVRLDAVRAGVRTVRAELDRAAESGAGHVLVDATDDADLDVLARALIEADAAAGRPLVAAGAAGLATALARVSGPRHPGAGLPRVPDRGRLIVAGSASEATRAQLQVFDGPRLTVDPLELAADDRALGALTARLEALLAVVDGPVLLAAANEPERVTAAREALGAGAAGELLESALAQLAVHAVRTAGVTRLIVAGGETSGAVVAGLGIPELTVGPQLEPGLAWVTGRPGGASDPVALLLKSGNFGSRELLNSAWRGAP